MKNTPLVPPHGTETPCIVPPHGTGNRAAVPPHGTIRPLFTPFPVPSHGHHLDICHLWVQSCARAPLSFMALKPPAAPWLKNGAHLFTVKRYEVRP